MADISALGNLNAAEPLDASTYVAPSAGGSFRLPKAGRYTVRAPESFPTTAFGKTRNGDLSAQIDPTIVGGEHDGFVVKFQRVSAKTYPRGAGKASQIGDYLTACGVEIPAGNSPQALADAVETTANVVYDVILDWKARNSTTGFQLKGMTNFKSDGNGGFQSWTEDPTEQDEKGDPKRLRANLEIVKFLPVGA